MFFQIFFMTLPFLFIIQILLHNFQLTIYDTIVSAMLIRELFIISWTNIMFYIQINKVFVNLVLWQNLISYHFKILLLVILNLWGSSPVPSSNGAYYYISFIDEYSKYIWFYLLHTKSYVQTIFKSFKLYYEKQIGFQI